MHGGSNVASLRDMPAITNVLINFRNQSAKKKNLIIKSGKRCSIIQD